MVGVQHILCLILGHPVEAERRRARDDRRVDAVALQIGDAAVGPVRVRLDEVLAVVQAERPAAEARR